VTALRIAHVHWAFPPTTGGVESHLSDLTRIQAASGHRLTVLTGETEPERCDAYEIVSTPLLDLRRVRGGTPPSYEPELRAFLARELGDREVDVVHAHDLHHFAAEPALVLDDLRRELGFALHHTFHETWPDVLADRPVYRAWDGNYAVSRFVAEGCARRLGFEPQLLPLAIDTDRFQPSDGRVRRVPVLLHPARLLPWKGVHVSVEMLAVLANLGIDARLVLTDTQRIADWDGELDDYRTTIAATVARLGLQDRVTYVRARYADMPDLYRHADVVLYPTVGDEPFGLVPLEAMSSGRPIVASRSGGIAETVVDGETGFIVPRDDVASLAARVAELLGDPALCARIGAAGRRHVLTHFDLHRFATRLELLYRARLPRPVGTG